MSETARLAGVHAELAEKEKLLGAVWAGSITPVPTGYAVRLEQRISWLKAVIQTTGK